MQVPNRFGNNQAGRGKLIFGIHLILAPVQTRFKNMVFTTASTHAYLRFPHFHMRFQPLDSILEVLSLANVTYVCACAKCVCVIKYMANTWQWFLHTWLHVLMSAPLNQHTKPRIGVILST